MNVIPANGDLSLTAPAAYANVGCTWTVCPSGEASSFDFRSRRQARARTRFACRSPFRHRSRSVTLSAFNLSAGAQLVIVGDFPPQDAGDMIVFSALSPPPLHVPVLLRSSLCIFFLVNGPLAPGNRYALGYSSGA